MAHWGADCTLGRLMMRSDFSCSSTIISLLRFSFFNIKSIFWGSQWIFEGLIKWGTLLMETRGRGKTLEWGIILLLLLMVLGLLSWSFRCMILGIATLMRDLCLWGNLTTIVLIGAWWSFSIVPTRLEHLFRCVEEELLLYIMVKKINLQKALYFMYICKMLFC